MLRACDVYFDMMIAGLYALFLSKDHLINPRRGRSSWLPLSSFQVNFMSLFIISFSVFEEFHDKPIQIAFNQIDLFWLKWYIDSFIIVMKI